MVHNSRIKRISLAVCLALMPFAVNAAGLGKLTVLSGLGEPLSAEIELSATKEELASLTAKIAPADAYAEQGLERPAVLSLIRIEVPQQSGGKSVIKLLSSQPIEAPFLDMLVQVEWSNGRLLREYTALLDPPGYGEAATAAVTQQAAVPSADKIKSTQRSGKTRKSTSKKPDAEQAPQTDEYMTRPGDTLRSIARQMQVEGVGLEQMLVGLYRTNQDAFIGGNMNRLKTGQVMRAPSSEELQSLTQQEAVKEIRIHTTDWNAYRNKLAGTVADSVAEGGPTQEQSSGGKITAPAEDKAAPAPTGPRDVVKLSKSDAGGKIAGQETAAGKEDAIARAKAAQEADARVAALEKQLQDMQKLLEIKSKDLADLQKAAPTVPAEKPQQQASAPATVAPIPPAPVPEAAPVAAEPAKPKKPRRPPPVVEPEPTLLDDQLMVSGIGGGLIVLLGGVWLYLRNKRRKGIDSFEQGILTTSGLRPNTVFGNTSGGLVDTGDTSFLTDLSAGVGGMIDTNDVDPIAEAEVYMAYGRDVQAEEILKDAIGRDPGRNELHQKLLEIYANRKDTTAFETLAGELYATLGASDTNWRKIAAMGFALEPENPLYQAEGLASAEHGESVGVQVEGVTPLATQADVPVDFGAISDAGGLELPTESPAPSPEAEGLDFALDETALADASAAVDISPVDQAMPTLETGEDMVPMTPEAEAVATDEAQDAGLDFSFELPEEASPDNVQLDAVDLGMAPELQGESSQRQDAEMLEMLPELAPVEESAAPQAAVEDIHFELPDLTPESAQPAPETETAGVELLDVDLDLSGTQEVVSPVAEEAVAQVSPGAPEIAIDFSADDSGLTSPAQEEVREGSLTAADADMAGGVTQAADFELPAPDVVAEDIVLDTGPAVEGGLDFDFDIDLGQGGSPVETDEKAASALPDLDLSGISLDLDEPSAPVDEFAVPESVSEVSLPVEEIEEISLGGSESADVDTKLDLVAAYMDMGDTEGARELLEEVLREGGEKQRERAQVLLSSLG